MNQFVREFGGLTNPHPSVHVFLWLLWLLLCFSFFSLDFVMSGSLLEQIFGVRL